MFPSFDFGLINGCHNCWSRGCNLYPDYDCLFDLVEWSF